MFGNYKNIKRNRPVKKIINLTAFSTFSLGIKVDRGVGVNGLIPLPGGHYIPVGGFGHYGNTEICKWQHCNCENASRWTISPLFHSLCAIGGQREGGVCRLLSCLGAKIFLFLISHGSNMKFCKRQAEKGITE